MDGKIFERLSQVFLSMNNFNPWQIAMHKPDIVNFTKKVSWENLLKKIMSMELKEDVKKPQDYYDKNVEKFYSEYVQPQTK